MSNGLIFKTYSNGKHVYHWAHASKLERSDRQTSWIAARTMGLDPLVKMLHQRLRCNGNIF